MSCAVRQMYLFVFYSSLFRAEPLPLSLLTTGALRYCHCDEQLGNKRQY